MRVANRKEYLQAKKAKDMARERGQVDEDELFLREGKSRIINFEFTSLKTFAVTSNFLTPDVIIALLQKFGAQYNKRQKAWILNINDYKEAIIDVNNFCKPRGIYVDIIPETLFDLLEYTIPFTDPTKQNVVEFDYASDFLQKPRLTSLPKHLMNALYDF